MRQARITVLISASFERSLAGIREFLASGDAQAAFDALIEHLSTEVIPSLEQFPKIGADFTARAPFSMEGQVLFERLVKLAGPGAEVRQLIDGDYVVLYLVRGTSLVLLSIKHHRQLSFDFSGHWPR